MVEFARFHVDRIEITDLRRRREVTGDRSTSKPRHSARTWRDSNLRSLQTRADLRARQDFDARYSPKRNGSMSASDGPCPIIFVQSSMLAAIMAPDTALCAR